MARTKKPAAVKAATQAQIKAAYMVLAHSSEQFKPSDEVLVLNDPDVFSLPGETNEYAPGIYEGHTHVVLEAMDENGNYTLRNDDGDRCKVAWYHLSLESRGDGRLPLKIADGNRDADIDEKGEEVHVGCTTVTFREVEAIYNAMVANRTPAVKKAPAKKAAKKAVSSRTGKPKRKYTRRS